MYTILCITNDKKEIPTLGTYRINIIRYEDANLAMSCYHFFFFVGKYLKQPVIK